MDKKQIITNSTAPPAIGLITQSGEQIPLRNIDVHVSIIDNYARVNIIQEYVNLNDNIVDVKFNFPKSAKSVFDSLCVKLDDGRKIIGIIEERKKAKIKYEQSVEKGETVVYAETGKTMSDIMTTKIGNLLPNQRLSVNFSYVEKVDISVNKYYKFIFPNALTPRYVPTSQFRQTLTNIINGNNIEDNLDAYKEIINNYSLDYLSVGNDSYLYPWNIKVDIGSSKQLEKCKSYVSSVCVYQCFFR